MMERPAAKIQRQFRPRVCWSPFVLLLLPLIPLPATAELQSEFFTAHDYRPGFVGLPEAHFWAETPGIDLPKPQATVTQLFDVAPEEVSVETLRRLDSKHQASYYAPRTDWQLAQAEAAQESIASRFGASNWHYGWGVGFDDVKLRVSYDF